jgi:hypothetical protein
VNGNAGVLVAPCGHLRLVLRLSFRDGRISEIETLAEAARLALVELGVLN